MTAHTPGPWSATNHFADPNARCNCAYVLCDGYAGSICTVSVSNGKSIGDGGNDSPPVDEAAANARLIAAAPDLLEALEEYMACVAFATRPRFANADVLTLAEAADRMEAARDAATAAIAKARGDAA